jgi:tRNA (cmo5U34)-methyltransferase
MEVGNQIRLQSETWSFADAIEHFDAHILQSIPACQEQREFIAALAKFFLFAGARVYEIGVATGTLAQAVLAAAPERRFDYIGLDIEPAMVAQARERLADDSRFSAVLADASDYAFVSPSLVLSYYTLQFLPLEQRMLLLQRLRQALTPGGALIMYEKTLGEDARVQDMLTQLYYDFKSQQGLDAEAILNKAVALRGVAMPLSLNGNQALLKAAGFATVEIIFRSHCFAGYLALRE